MGSLLGTIWEFPKIRGSYQFEGPHNKDYNILESISGSPYFGKVPYWRQYQTTGGNPTATVKGLVLILPVDHIAP